MTYRISTAPFTNEELARLVNQFTNEVAYANDNASEVNHLLTVERVNACLVLLGEYQVNRFIYSPRESISRMADLVEGTPVMIPMVPSLDGGNEASIRYYRECEKAIADWRAAADGEPTDG